MVVVLCRITIFLDTANVYVILINHNHHLPLILVFRHSSVFRSSELGTAKFVVKTLGSGLDENLTQIVGILPESRHYLLAVLHK